VPEENLSSEVRTLAHLSTIIFCFLCFFANERTITEQFEDEIHPRLRFPHRGLVAMANSGKKNSNDSQFFITLGAVKSYFMHTVAQFSLGMMQTGRMSCMVSTRFSGAV